MYYLAVNKLDIMGTLRIAVTSSVFRAGLVTGMLRLATIRVHLNKIQRSVQSTREFRHINIERKLLVLGLKHLIPGIGRIHQVNSRTDILPRALRDKLMCQCIPAGRNTVRAAIVRSIDRTVLRTRDGIRTQCSVPRVAGEAVCEAGGGVEPSPVGVQDD